MREKSETNLKITIYFFLFGKVDKLIFESVIGGAFSLASLVKGRGTAERGGGILG